MDTKLGSETNATLIVIMVTLGEIDLMKRKNL